MRKQIALDDYAGVFSAERQFVLTV